MTAPEIPGPSLLSCNLNLYVRPLSPRSSTSRFITGPYVTSICGTTNQLREGAASLSGGSFSFHFLRPSYQDDAVPDFTGENCQSRGAVVEEPAKRNVLHGVLYLKAHRNAFKTMLSPLPPEPQRPVCPASTSALSSATWRSFCFFCAVLLATASPTSLRRRSNTCSSSRTTLFLRMAQAALFSRVCPSTSSYRSSPLTDTV